MRSSIALLAGSGAPSGTRKQDAYDCSSSHVTLNLNDLHFQVNKQLRAAIGVARQNLISDAPFSKVDFVSCRNLMIYLEPDLQQKIISLFHFALNENGYLLPGCSESIGRHSDLFDSFSKKWRIFRRVGPVRPEPAKIPIMSKEDHPFTAGPQPSATQLQQLQSDGFKSIVNFRNEGEDAESMSSQAEADAVRAAGLSYLHIPVTLKAMAAESVDTFRAEYPQLPKPIFAHCKSGKRAAAMAMMNIAVEDGLTADQSLINAREMGLDLDQPELQSFMQTYINSRSQATKPV